MIEDWDMDLLRPFMCLTSYKCWVTLGGSPKNYQWDVLSMTNAIA